MLIVKPPDIPSSEITPRDAYERYLNRRRFLRAAASAAVAAGAAALGAERIVEVLSPRDSALAGTKLETVKSPLTTTGEQLTSFEDITHYNNFYEFGVDKDQPAKNAGVLPTRALKGWSSSRRPSTSMPCSSCARSKIESTAIAASRPGAW